MTFSMATDGYPSMHPPWGHWPPFHMQGSACLPHHWQSSMPPTNTSCMYGMTPDYRVEKPPLTQLQELASVFPPAVKTEFLTSEAAETNFLPNSPFLAKERCSERECDSGYSHDHKPIIQDRDLDLDYGSDRPFKCENSFLPEMSVPRECDSGFGPTYSGKEEPEPECDSGYAPEGGRTPVIAGDSDSGCADVIGKWEEDTPNVLPGFQQAFGSTEIGRFSRNDFFTNPSPPLPIDPEPPRKQTRKPRSPRVKQVKQSDSPKLRAIEQRRDRVPSVPMIEGPPCSPRICGPPYQSSIPHYEPPCPPSRYCGDHPHPYIRNYAPSYPSCELPYFRPLPFPVDCGQSWAEPPRWSHYQQPYQPPPQQPWTSANVYPYMRLDY